MTLTVQFQTMLSMLGMGIWLGMAVDTYGRFLHEKRKWHWFHFINDILFWILQSLLVFYVLLHVNHAEIRFYIFLALICGYAAYRALFEKMYRRALEGFISIVLWVIRFFKRLIYVLVIAPIQWIFKIVSSLLIGVLSLVWSVVKFILRVLFAPFMWIGRLIWRFIPKQTWYNFRDKCMRFAGNCRLLMNKIIKWFKK